MAHSFFKTNLLVGLLLSLTTQAAYSQNQYTYRMGNQRVQQGHGGLAAGGTSSYITGGTLSHSAQVGAGVASPYGNLQNGSSSNGAGMVGNNGLQAARMGSTVGVAGDYMRSDINPNVTFQQPRQQYQRRQQVNYTVNYNQANPNVPATYNYARSSSNTTGRGAQQIPTIIPNQQQAQAPQQAAQAAPAATTAASSGSGAASAEYKGY